MLIKNRLKDLSAVAGKAGKNSMDKAGKIPVGTEEKSPVDITDITGIWIDTSRPVEQRIDSFLKQAGNPYFFKVKDTPVRVSFSKNGCALSDCLVKAFEQE